MKRTQMMRIFCLILAVLVFLPNTLLASAYGKCSEWAIEQLDEIEAAGLIPASLEEADMTVNITRQELCQMAILAYRKATGRTELKPDKTTYFKDTADPDICLAYELGIVSGYTNGNFGPNDKLTRQELFQILFTLFKSVGWTEKEIQDPYTACTDSKYVSNFAVSATKTMLELGIVSGTGNNKISPGGTATIEQSLCLLDRAYDYARYFMAESGVYKFFPAFPGYDGVNDLDPNTLPVRPGEEEFPEEHVYADCSSWAAENLGVMEVWGLIPKSLYGLDFAKSNITREQFCEAAVQCYQALTGDLSAPGFLGYFKDTQNPNVCKAKELMIVSGYTDDTFRPNKSITRQEMFTMILNFLHAVGWEELNSEHELFAQFSDSGRIGSWAKTAAKVAIQLEIVKGDGNGKLNPTANCSRQEAAIMFYRGFRYINLWYSEHPLNPDTYPGHIAVDNPNAQKAVDLAVSKIGCWYVYGAAGPNTFDCSGLVYWIYHTQLGYSMGRTATAQWKNGIQISVDWSHPGKTLKPGDLIYFRSSSGSSSIGHIGIYVGATYNGKPTPYGEFTFIHAPHTGAQVCYSDLHWWISVNRIYGARRIAY